MPISASSYIKAFSQSVSSASQLVEQEISSYPFLSKTIRPHGIQASLKKGDKPAIKVTSGRRDMDSKSASINHDTVCHIASMTKIFTAAALLRFWDKEITQRKQLEDKKLDPSAVNKFHFPDGMNTKLSNFIPALQAKYPDNVYLYEIEQVPHYQQITLADLLNHTHGLGGVDAAKLREQQIDDPDRHITCSEKLSMTVRSAKDVHGKFRYGNVGFDLAGMIMESITGKQSDEILKSEVIAPLQLNNTYTLSEAPAAYAQPNANVATGYAFTSKNRLFHDAKDVIKKDGIINHNTSSNGRADTGIKSCPDDGHKLLRKYLSKDPKVSMFDNQEIRDAMWNRVNEKGEKHDYHFATGTVEGGYYGHDGSGTAFATLFLYNPDQDTSFYYAASGETLTHNTAFEIAKELYQEEYKAHKLNNTKHVMPIRESLAAQYSFAEILQNREAIMAKEVALLKASNISSNNLFTNTNMRSVMRTNNSKAIGTVTAREVIEAANKYGVNKGKVNSAQDKEVKSILEALSIPSNTDLEQPVSIKVRDDIVYDKVYQTDPKEKSGKTSEQITTAIVQDINNVAQTKSEAKVTDIPAKRSAPAMESPAKKPKSAEADSKIKGKFTAQVVAPERSQSSQNQGVGGRS